MNELKMMKFIYRVFLIVGILCIIAGIATTINKIWFISRAASAEGVVIRLIEVRSGTGSDKNITYRPEVRFNTPGGGNVTFVSSVSSNPPRFETDSRVKVLYDRKNPQSAEIDSFLTLWLLPLILFAMALVFTLISGIGFNRINKGKPLKVSYSIQLSFREFLYMFKRKKTCPLCGGLLLKDKRAVEPGTGVKGDRSTYTYDSNNVIKYFYKCSGCQKVFPLEQLSKKS